MVITFTEARRNQATVRCAVFAVVAVATLASASAQETPDAGAHAADAGAPADGGPPSDVTLPELLDAPVVSYPPEALAARAEGTVPLLLTIDAEGQVVASEVLVPLGHGLDEAARAASLRFRFSPARKGGRPVAARVRHEFVWTLPPPPPVPRPPPAAAPPAQEVTVRGKTEAQRLRESARAVHVIETKEARREAADLGEVLARSQGIGVRRGGGLGSAMRFSLNGLTDDQVRFFLDGVPLDLAGYPFGIANVPVNLIDRVEVYRGVVPIRFGADALGGAVNLVSEDDVRGTRASGSYQEGSFGTRRLTAGGHHVHEPTGAFARASAFLDMADNDYPVDVEVPDPQQRGRQIPGRAYRFHDGYRAAGANVEAGFVRRPWADRLVLRAFGTDLARDIQSNPTMELPYGEVTYAKATGGVGLRFRHRVLPRLSVDLVGGYTYAESRFRDVSTCFYGWFGQCVRQRLRPGEIEEGNPRDDTLFEHAGYVRLVAEWALGAAQVLRLSTAPTVIARDGEDRLRVAGAVTPERRLSTLVSGVEHQITALSSRLENIAFAKSYLQAARSRERLRADASRLLDSDTVRFGFGDSLRLRLASWVYAKASYEYATRLPRADEVFGDGVLTNENLGIAPEVSHNGNLGFAVATRGPRWGSLRADVNGFLRDAENLIVLLPAYGQRFRFENVFAARSLGVEASAGWTSRAERVSFDGNVTYLDFRNLASTGPFAQFDGNRIPNRPYLFANAVAQLAAPSWFTPGDRLSLTWYTRYVHEFFEFWEGAGARDSKRTIPDQLLHTAVVTYLVAHRERSFSFSGEVSNLTDAAAYDFFGAQRPGRAVFFKTTVQY